MIDKLTASEVAALDQLFASASRIVDNLIVAAQGRPATMPDDEAFMYLAAVLEALSIDDKNSSNVCMVAACMLIRLARVPA